MQHLPRPLNTLQSLIFPGFLENKFSLPIMRGIALAEKHPIIYSPQIKQICPSIVASFRKNLRQMSLLLLRKVGINKGGGKALFG